MSVKLPIYLDYSATTPVDPRVAEKMIPFLTETFGNPASRSHSFGWIAEKAVEEARAEVETWSTPIPRKSSGPRRDRIGQPGDQRRGLPLSDQGRHLITVKTEHKAVLDTMRELEAQGFEITTSILFPTAFDLNAFREAIRPDTILASVMHVSNEIGVIQTSPPSARSARKGVIFHVDAAQSTGKGRDRPFRLPVDDVVPAHKTYGPKGIGALYVRRQPQCGKAMMHGGGRAYVPTPHPPDRRHGRSVPSPARRWRRKTHSEVRDKLLAAVRIEVYISGDLEHEFPTSMSASTTWKANP